MNKTKFKNNKRRLSLEEMTNQLLKEYQSLLVLFEKKVFGKSEHLASDIFPKLRALLCHSGNMNPLLFRILSQYELDFPFYTNSKPKIDGLHFDFLVTKSWSPIPTKTYKTKITLNEYLNEDYFYNSIEERYISRDDALRKIADKEGAHFDIEIDLFSDYLSDTITTSSGIEFSQKEMLMWDIGLLTLWTIQRLKLSLRKRQFEKLNQLDERKVKEYFENVNNVDKHYYGKILFPDFGLKIMFQKVCKKCQTPLIKNDLTTYICPKCGNIEEL